MIGISSFVFGLRNPASLNLIVRWTQAAAAQWHATTGRHDGKH